MDIPRLSIADGFYHFMQRYLLPNQPCMLEEQYTSEWKARKLWQKEGRPDFEYLKKTFGQLCSEQ